MVFDKVVTGTGTYSEIPILEVVVTDAQTSIVNPAAGTCTKGGISMPISVTLINPPLNEITIALVRTDPSIVVDAAAAATAAAAVVAADAATDAAVVVEPWAGLDVMTEGA